MVQDSSNISVATAFRLLYGYEPSADALRLAARLIGHETVDSLSDLRAVIMGLDRQDYPTAALVRFSESDLHTIHIEGFRLRVDKSDIAVSAPIINSKQYETHLTGVFKRYIKPGWRVVDIGANIGYFTMLAASIVGIEGQVLAFDPNSENGRLILLNIQENKFSNVELFPLALAETTGYAYFSSHVGSNGGLLASSVEQLSDGRGLVVPTARLDELVKSSVDFIKVDVEGAEYRVIRGSQGVLSASRPIVSTEFSCEMIQRVSGVRPREYLALFLAYGYAIYLIDKTTGRLEAIGDVDDFLGSWGDPFRIEDLILLPQGTQVLQPT